MHLYIIFFAYLKLFLYIFQKTIFTNMEFARAISPPYGYEKPAVRQIAPNLGGLAHIAKVDFIYCHKKMIPNDVKNEVKREKNTRFNIL